MHKAELLMVFCKMCDSCHHCSAPGWGTPKPKVDNASFLWQKAMLKPTHFNWSQPYCPLSSSVPLPFTFDLTFLTSWSCSAAALTPVVKEEIKKVFWLLVKNGRHMHTHATYLDCISFVMFQLWYGPALLQWVTHPPAPLHGSVQAPVLHVPTIRVSFWLSG